MAILSESLFYALNRAESNNQPPDSAANTALNARGFIRWTDSGGYEYVNRNTTNSPTRDGYTHVILFQYDPIMYVKLGKNMVEVETWAWTSLTEILTFLDGPLYTGNGIQLQVSCDAVLV